LKNWWSAVDKIYRVKSNSCPNPEDLARSLAKLEKAACQCDTAKVLDGIFALVPAFRPEHQEASIAGKPAGWAAAALTARNRTDNGSAPSAWSLAKRAEGLGSA
jgi:hypothetical protein